MADADLATCNWTLLNLRKTGGLGPVVTRRRQVQHDDYLHASEIAARLMYDKHPLSMDRVLCIPTHRQEFDRIAQSILAAGSSPESNGPQEAAAISN